MLRVTKGTVPLVTFSWENVTMGTVPVVTLFDYFMVFCTPRNTGTPVSLSTMAYTKGLSRLIS